MKTIRVVARVSGVALVVFLSIATNASAQDEAPDEGNDFSTRAMDQAKCKLQLNILYGAIEQYRKQHGDLPNKLSDLGSDLIADPATFVCPFVQNRGGLRHWKKRFQDWAGDANTSYSYEMSLTPLSAAHWRGLPKKTWRDFKNRQMKELKTNVPVVRCLDHRPVLNLTMDGRIYESGEYWERVFSNDDHLLTVANVFRSVPRVLNERDFPPRDPAAGIRLLNLAPIYNGSLTDGWQGFPGNHLKALRAGTHEFDGVRFDVRGVIQLRGTEIPVDFPAQVSGIPVHQKCSRIHFLHATGFGYRADTVQASYRMNYSDKTEQEFPVVSGQHFADWWHPSSQTNAPTKATIAWTGENEASKAFGQVLSLYHATWDNPKPGTEIDSITFDAGTKPFLAGPFVLAITLE